MIPETVMTVATHDSGEHNYDCGDSHHNSGDCDHDSGDRDVCDFLWPIMITVSIIMNGCDRHHDSGDCDRYLCDHDHDSGEHYNERQ